MQGVSFLSDSLARVGVLYAAGQGETPSTSVGLPRTSPLCPQPWEEEEEEEGYCTGPPGRQEARLERAASSGAQEQDSGFPWHQGDKT